MVRSLEKEWRKCLEQIDSSLSDKTEATVSILGKLNAAAVNAVRGLHRILLATLGGVPCADNREHKEKYEVAKKAMDNITDILDNTIFIVTKNDQGKKDVVPYRELLHLFCHSIENGRSVESAFKSLHIEKLDEKAAKVLYGVKRKKQS